MIWVTGLILLMIYVTSVRGRKRFKCYIKILLLLYTLLLGNSRDPQQSQYITEKRWGSLDI